MAPSFYRAARRIATPAAPMSQAWPLAPGTCGLSGVDLRPRRRYLEAAVYAQFKGSGRLPTLGLDMVLSVVFGLFGGRWLDGQLGAAPYLTIAGLIFGVLAAVRFLVRGVRHMKRQTEEDGFAAARLDRPARFAFDEERRRR
jgi:F0F1-type ATP synthase assembly protein I